MKKLIFILPLLLVFACGNDKEDEKVEVVELKTSKDKLSYSIGSMTGQQMMNSGDENMKKLDKDQLIKGFEAGFKNDEPKDCEETIKKLFGPYFQDFDTTHIKDGSECIGRLTGYSVYKNLESTNSLNDVDAKMIKAGFEYAVRGRDTLMTEQEKTQIIQDFMMKARDASDAKMMDEAKKIPNAQIYDNGVVMVTLKEGTGGMPGPTDDVQVEYVLTNANGEVIQDSKELNKQNGSTEPTALNLASVVPGWTFAVQKMKKGGEYEIYLPSDQGYGREPLHFKMTLINYGPSGTFVKPEAAMPQ